MVTKRWAAMAEARRRCSGLRTEIGEERAEEGAAWREGMWCKGVGGWKSEAERRRSAATQRRDSGRRVDGAAFGVDWLQWPMQGLR